MSLIEFIHQTGFEQMPPDVQRQARRCLLDLIGVAASGMSTESSRIILKHVARHYKASESDGARLIFDGRRVSAPGAAFAGATIIDSFDAHDGHALTKGHAGVAILPALMAISDAEKLEIDIGEMLACIVIGYEIATRAGIALHATACDYHTSGAWNGLACAAIGSRLLKLSPSLTREAIGIAEYNGPRSQMMRCIQWPTMVKDGSGWGALAGVSAAYLAADGFTGAPAISVEAEDVADIWADLGVRWYTLEQYFKPYPVCRWAQPAIRAARQLMDDNDLSGEDITDVEVQTFAEAVALHTAAPENTEEAQYSLPFPLAVMILKGRIGADEITGAGLSDHEVLDLSKRIRLVAEPGICALFPAKRLAIVKLTTRDGRTFQSVPTEAHGGASNPMSDREIDEKFDQLAGRLGAVRMQAIRKAINDNETCASGLADLILSEVVETI